MKVIVTSGGTGGHIYPALSLIKYLENNGEEVLFIGKKDSLEERLSQKDDIQFEGLEIARGKGIISKLKLFIYIFKSILKSLKIFNSFKPDVVIGFGNYISVPVVLAAKIKKIPILLHEQNTVMGKANFLLGFLAKNIICSLPLVKEFHKNKLLYYGNSRSNECLKSKYNNHKIDMTKNNILIFMGSLGSSTVNEVLVHFINNNEDHNIYHIVTGRNHYEKFIQRINNKQNIIIYPYIDDMISIMKKCDLVITRSGATTVSEITALGLASILIPSPYVSNNHQYYNANYLHKNNACVLLEEKNLTPITLKNNIENILTNTELRINLRINSLKLAIFDTNNKIHKLLKELIYES